MKKIIHIIRSIWTSSIRRQLMFGIILVHAVLMTIFVYDLVNRQRDFLHTQSIAQANSLAETLAANSVSWILANDIFGLEEILQSQKRYPDLKYAMVLSPDGRVLSHTDDDKIGLYISDKISHTLLTSKKQKHSLISANNLIDVVSPIYSNKEFIGWARVGLDQDSISSSLNTITRDGIFYTLLAIFIGSLFAYFMANGITKGLKHLVDIADGIKGGNLNLRSTLSRNDELGHLSDDFNQMLDTIKKGKHDLQGIMDNSPAVIYAKDLDGRYVFINQKWERLFDKDKKGIIGKTDHDIFDKELADKFVSNDKAVLKAQHALESEEIAPHEDGIHTYMSIKFPLFKDDGNIYSICGISTDITERKIMEENLISSEQHLNLYREQSPLASIEWNTDFQVIYWNSAAENIFGYTFEEVKGRTPFEFMVPDNIKVDIHKVWNELMTQTGGTTSINENITKGGQIILCEWHNSPLIDETGNVIGAASIGQNVTERKQQEEQLRRSQKMEALGKLTGGIAHDYNNMLGVVIGYAEILEDMLEQQPNLAKYAHEIHHAGKRGAKLTKKLLDFSGQKSADATVININKLLEHQHLMLEKTLTARIKLVIELEENIWPIWLDSGDIEDAILNISINAMHAIKGNGQLTIQTRNQQVNTYNAKLLQLEPGDYVLLDIIDTGCGIDEIIKEKIFDPFYTTKGELGTGLGLSQVYGFIERSNGAIKVYSELNQGTRFTLYFPRYFGNTEKQFSSVTNNIMNVAGNETILVVDDELALLNLTSEILSQQGYNIIKTNNSRDALEILKNKSIDLLLSDIIMPDMDGYELAATVQKKYPTVKIQLASGFSDDRHLHNLDETLHKNLLHKPYQAQTLLKRIRKLLDES